MGRGWRATPIIGLGWILAFLPARALAVSLILLLDTQGIDY